MRRARAFSIRGKITGLGSPQPRYRLALTQNGRYQNTAEVHDGTFLFGAIPAGSYVVKTMLDVWNHENGPTLFCDYPVEVGEKNVEGLAIPAMPVGDLTGRIKMDSPMPEKRPRILLEPKNVIWPGNPLDASPDENGAFRKAALPPDEYTLRVLDLPEGFYVKSTRYDGQTVSNSTLDLTSATRGELEITLAPNAAEVKGVVTDDDGKPVLYETVAIWNANSFDQRGSGKSGSFEFHNLAPGDYFIASAEIDYGPLSEVDVRAKLQTIATKVSLQEGSREKVDVKIVRAAGN